MIVYLCFDSVALRRIRLTNPTRDPWDVIGCSRPEQYIVACDHDLANKFDDHNVPTGWHVGRWEFEDEEDQLELQKALDQHGNVCNFVIDWN